MFEVQDLKYATLATVSRCGMVWFSNDVVAPEMIIENYSRKLRFIPLEESEEDIRSMQAKSVTGGSKEEEKISPTLQVLIDLFIFNFVFHGTLTNWEGNKSCCLL